MLGVVTGYTAEEAAAVPNLTADELLAYFDRRVIGRANPRGDGLVFPLWPLIENQTVLYGTVR